MQIVIEIPDDDAKFLMESSFIPVGYFDLVHKALHDGIVLPKNHGDLIDRDMCLEMKCRDLVDADGVTMYAVPTGNILRMKPVIPADKEDI